MGEHFSKFGVLVPRDEYEAIIHELADAKCRLDAITNHLIARIDAIDPDCEQEDATDLEDDFSFSELAQVYVKNDGPGCTISDPPEEDDPSAQCSEDEISCGPGQKGGLWLRDSGPGCPLSDPAGLEAGDIL